MTDSDGALTPILDDPAGAELTAETRQRLRASARPPVSGIAAISGRGLKHLRGRMDIPEAICAGCHSVEIQSPDFNARNAGEAWR